MKCPYCNTEMILGYIQCRDGVYWSKWKRLIAALPALDESAVLLSFKNRVFSISAAKAYRCIKCNKIIIDYDKEK